MEVSLSREAAIGQTERVYDKLASIATSMGTRRPPCNGSVPLCSPLSRLPCVVDEYNDRLEQKLLSHYQTVDMRST